MLVSDTKSRFPSLRARCASPPNQGAEQPAGDDPVQEQAAERRPGEEDAEQQREQRADQRSLAETYKCRPAGRHPALNLLHGPQVLADDRRALDREPLVREVVDRVLCG